MISKPIFVASLSLFIHLSTGQVPPAAVYNSSFNSSFTLTPSQIAAAQLSPDTVESVQNAINFERSQLAYGGPHEDDFYTLPPLTNTTALKPGEILKVQHVTDPSAFAIPPNTALSRIMYTTTNFNGTVIPATGYILWPFTPRQFGAHGKSTACSGNATAAKASVVVFLHGTSGYFAPAAPSTQRTLYYDHHAPYTLALAGYAVFAPDYAGLGVAASWDGGRVPHQYSVSPASARDALFGLRAALAAFPDRLANNWVALGHSQGGGVTWALAEALARDSDDGEGADDFEFADVAAGYRGAIPGAPTTDFFKNGPGFEGLLVTSAGFGLDSIFPEFELGEWLTPLGVARAELARELEAGIATILQLMMGGNETVVKGDFRQSWYVQAFTRIASAGRKDFRGPLLVLQGTDDLYIPYELTWGAVQETWEMFPDRDLEIVVVDGVGHVPVLDATRQVWMKWIEDRLSGKDVERKGGVRTDLKSWLPLEQYLHAGYSVLSWVNLPEYTYQQQLAV